MHGPHRPGPEPTEPPGTGGSWRPSIALLAVALGIVVGGVAYWWVSSPPAAADPAPQATLPTVASVSTPTAPAATRSASSIAPTAATRVATPATALAASAPRIARVRDPNGDQSPDISDYINEGEVPTMAEVIDRLHRAGVHTGLGAFQPPGTRPPLVGLAVPEDYPLPEGYVRHYQATDDGQRIEPILMFAPDHPFFDAAGRPIAIPKDRVVPPELAPPGMPIRRVVIPKPIDPQRP